MDKALVSGTSDLGSIPSGTTTPAATRPATELVRSNQGRKQKNLLATPEGSENYNKSPIYVEIVSGLFRERLALPDFASHIR